MTLRQIYNALTGDFNLVNVESGWSGEVTNYSALPTASSHDGEVYLVLNSQGTAWLPGTLGGTFYSKGFYKSVSSAWEFLGAVPYQATQAQVNTGTATDVFVSPSTLANSTQWSTKVSSVVAGTNVTVDNTDPLNPIVSSSGGGGTITNTTPTDLTGILIGNGANVGAVTYGSDGQVLTMVAGAPAFATGGGMGIGRLVVGSSVCPTIVTLASNTNAFINSSSAFFIPFVLEDTITISTIKLFIATGVAASTVRFGIYSSDGQLPTTPLAVSGNTASTTNDTLLTYTPSSSVQLVKGVTYYIYVAASSGSIAFRGIATSQSVVIGVLTTGLFNTLYNMRTKSGSYAGGAPNPATGTVLATNAYPMVTFDIASKP